MKHYVITIARQFGSLGRPIARQLSEILGVDFYDRDIVEATAQKTRNRAWRNEKSVIQSNGYKKRRTSG